jgi:hypothetical protein
MAEFFNKNILDTQLKELEKKQRDNDFYASLAPMAEAQSGGVAREEAEANWLQDQIKTMTPQSIYEELLEKEWGKKKVPGKILTALGELARGAASRRGQYVPFSERLQGRAQKEYDSRSKALTGLERIQSSERKTMDTLAQRDRALSENTALRQQANEIKLELGTKKNEIADFTARAQAQRWGNEFLVNSGKLSVEQQKLLISADKQTREQLLVASLKDDPEWAKMNKDQRNAAIAEIGKALDAGKMATATIRGKNAPGKGLVYQAGSNVYWYNPENSDHGFGKLSQIWDKFSGNINRLHPDDPNRSGAGIKSMPKDTYDAWTDFRRAASQSRAAMGNQAAMLQQKKNIEGFWDTKYGAQFRKSIEYWAPKLGYMGLSAEEALSNTAILNAALMHSSAQMGYRPPQELVRHLADSIGASPGGSIEAKLRSSAAFTLLSELAEMTEIAPMHGIDPETWGTESPWFGFKVKTAVEQYVSEVKAGNPNASLPNIAELLGQPFYGRKKKAPLGFGGREAPQTQEEDPFDAIP